MNNRFIKDIVIKAINKFYEKDQILISVEGMEQACVFRIGLYLNDLLQQNEELKHLDLDCEYNKSNSGTKILAGRQIRPDLIIHKRNLNNTIANNYNTLVIEFKGWWDNNLSDIEKLKDFTNEIHGYHYPLTMFVQLGQTKDKTIYRYFQNGVEISEDNILENS